MAWRMHALCGLMWCDSIASYVDMAMGLACGDMVVVGSAFEEGVEEHMHLLIFVVL